MSSRRVDSASTPAVDFWRQLAHQAGYDLQAAARLLQTSLRQLERECQRELRCTPRDWFQQERMKLATQLLADGQPVKVVALHLGYTQLSNFSRDFKRHFGQTPRAFAPRPRLTLPPASPTRSQS